MKDLSKGVEVVVEVSAPPKDQSKYSDESSIPVEGAIVAPRQDLNSVKIDPSKSVGVDANFSTPPKDLSIYSFVVSSDLVVVSRAPSVFSTPPQDLDSASPLTKVNNVTTSTQAPLENPKNLFLQRNQEALGNFSKED